MGPKRITGLLALATTLHATAVWAQSAEDTAAARALFAEARKLAAAGDFATACPKFEESQRLEPGVGTQFNLADCWEHIGRTASAWALFLEVANRTRLAGQVEREQVARRRAAALEPRLSTLTVTVEQQIEGLEIRRGEVIVGAAQVGVATPVDPGEQLIRATAPGYEPWSGRVDVPPDGGAEAVVVPRLVPAVADEPASPDAPGAAPPALSTPTRVAMPSAPSPPGQDAPSRTRLVGYGLLGLGAVGLGAGTYFGVVVKNRDGELADICPTGEGCTTAEVLRYGTVRDEAVAARAASYVAFGAGMAALGAGAVLTLWQSGSREARDIRLRVGARGVQVEGDW